MPKFVFAVASMPFQCFVMVGVAPGNVELEVGKSMGRSRLGSGLQGFERVLKALAAVAVKRLEWQRRDRMHYYDLTMEAEVVEVAGVDGLGGLGGLY